MLFGRAPAKERVPLPELEAYLGRCFDGKLRRLSTRLPEIERDLSDSFADFGAAVRKFSDSSVAPDMEYLYRIKENFMESQKANYSSSVLHLVSATPKYGGNGLYFKAKEMLDAYSSFTTSVLKTNNTFKFVMVGYAKALADVKRHFTAMEKSCNELRNEIASCALEESEYGRIRSRIMAMLENASEIEELRNPPPQDAHHALLDESVEGTIRKQIEEKEAHLVHARHRYREADSVLASLLLPVERAARKHDHLSTSKRKLADYMKDPAEHIRTAEDGSIIHSHLLEIAEEVRTGKIDTKHPEILIAQIDAIRSKDLLALSASSREAAVELRKLENELAELHAHLQALEKGKAEKQKVEAGKARTEQEISLKHTRLLSEKKELERLFLDCYKKHADIILP